MIGATFLTPENARIALPVALIVGYACYHWWRWRMQHPKVRTEEPPKPTEPNAEIPSESKRESTAEPIEPPVAAIANAPHEEAKSEKQEVQPLVSSAGEEKYRRARAIPHQEIPDYRIDGLYLDLLGESAVLGYAPAMAKLGEYAMRRGTWVEAYYWMWRARRNGMANLDNVLRGIRLNWTLLGAPNESQNVYALFPEESGSIGRALLHIDSGRDAYAAKEYLKSCHTEFLDA